MSTIMSNQNKEWNNVNKRRNKRPYKNKKQSKSNLKSKFHSKNTKNNTRKENYGNSIITSQNDFPSLLLENNTIKNSKFKVQNTFNSSVWRKNLETSVKDTIYVKAKNGASILNSYPLLDDTLRFPLFQ